MNILTTLQSSSLPGYLFQQPPCSRLTPHVVEIGDAWGKTGSGVGDEHSSAYAALGEYFERRHFYMEIAAERRARLKDVMSVDEAASFRAAFLQTSQQKIMPTCVDEHLFAMTKAYRTRDFSACSIPSVVLNLTHGKDEPDDLFYPQRDTCGCSFHLSSDLSIFGAIRESLERQFLTRFWLTKRCNFILGANTISRQLRGRPLNDFFKVISQGGELMAIDISDERFPGKCTVLIYGSQDPTRQVRYCAGMAYSNSLTEALEKSLIELWQTFRFMQLFGALKKDASNIEDGYLRHFLNCNRMETFEEMRNVVQTCKKPNLAEVKGEQMTTTNLLSTLRRLNLNGYLYSKKIAHTGNHYTLTKFISPFLFMHMNNANNINIENQYSSEFTHDILPARQAVMVPFP